MNAVLSSSAAARPVVGGAPARRSVGVVSRPAGSSGVRVAGNPMHTVRAATLNLARNADDLRVGSSMTAASNRFRAAAVDARTPARAITGAARSNRR